MKEFYSTSEVARIVGIHSNTVRLYEKLNLISAPKRKTNGYRVFTKFHIDQIKIARMAFQIEVLQNGLRKQAVKIIKASALGEFDQAIELTKAYLQRIKIEKDNAEEAVRIVGQILSGESHEKGKLNLTRQEAADYLHITIDTLRNWELNGLLSVRRKINGYRMYTGEDMERLKIIRSLRCANYSLAAILRMLQALSQDPQTNIRTAIDTPSAEEDIISVCDHLLTSLECAEENANKIYKVLLEMEKTYFFKPPLLHQT